MCVCVGTHVSETTKTTPSNLNLFILQGYDSVINHDMPDEIKEKLAIARILLNDPDLLMLDNCMNNINIFTQMAIITDFVSISTLKNKKIKQNVC